MLLGTINISVSAGGKGGGKFQLFALILWIFVSGFSLPFVKLNTYIHIKLT